MAKSRPNRNLKFHFYFSLSTVPKCTRWSSQFEIRQNFYTKIKFSVAFEAVMFQIVSRWSSQIKCRRKLSLDIFSIKNKFSIVFQVVVSQIVIWYLLRNIKVSVIFRVSIYLNVGDKFLRSTFDKTCHLKLFDKNRISRSFLTCDLRSSS